jgi:uncharacterized membrane protein
MHFSEDQYQALQQKILLLENEQIVHLKKLESLKQELNLLKTTFDENTAINLSAPETVKTPLPQTLPETEKTPFPPQAKPERAAYPNKDNYTGGFVPERNSKSGIDFEKYIGENIISKIGILILVIGVSIGTKFAIDNDLLSPLARISCGYLLGAVLLAFALKFKTKYENFSAILVSGAMAILYLITFAAYNLYNLFPQGVAFGLMVLFTGFTVSAALHYNREWIAFLGMVGAYAVPFLLSNNSGNVQILFSYMALLNLGILAVAVKRYWLVLYYSAFGISWLIFISWFIGSYQSDKHFFTGLIFSTLFFLLFYAVFLIYKLNAHRKFEPVDVLFLLFNSFIFYAIGFAILSDNETVSKLTGLFTLGNAGIHFIIAMLIYRMQLADRNLFFLVSGLVLVFITIAIPVQLDGNWVTLIWSAQAALLYWIGRSKNIHFYEALSYPLMILAAVSQVHDWGGLQLPYSGMYLEKTTTPLLNSPFFISLFVMAAFGFISWMGWRFPQEKQEDTVRSTPKYVHFMGTIFPNAVALLLLYFSLRNELVHFWNIKYGLAHIEDSYYYFSYNAPSLLVLNVWTLNYTMLFVTVLAVLNIKLIKNTIFTYALSIFGLLALITFLSGGLNWLGMLRDGNQQSANSGDPIVSHMVVNLLRYLSIACVAFLLFGLFQLHKQLKHSISKSTLLFDGALHISIIFIGSSELITWLIHVQSAQFDKLGLSIFWGLYSLVLIGLGIFTRKQHLRIGAGILFGITLIKLFFYDIVHLNTMSKTIVFISLGILLLIISFLYNKYKNKILTSDAP